jgi:hypothetical protein
VRFVQAGGGKPRLEEVAYRNVPARITAVLLRVSKGHNGEEVPATHQELLLRSLNAVTKNTPIMTMILGRATPDPGRGSPVELGRRDTRRLLALIGVSKTLASECIAAEEPPPAFLQVKPAGSRRDKDMMEARMLGHPGACLSTIMTAEIIREKKDVTPWIVRFDVLKQSAIVRGVA